MIIRSAGILMPVSALPSAGGIGTLGNKAFEFAERLCDAGQRYWQVLPLGPAGAGDSPYQPLSAFAGGELYIDTDRLCADGLLRKDELPHGESRFVNYAAVRRERMALLRLAYSRFKPDEKYAEFCAACGEWLEPYAMFAAIRRQYNGAPVSKWEETDREYSDAVRERYGEKLGGDIAFYKFCQYRFMSDWDALHRFCGKLGVRLIGDLPIYVSPDSADVWSMPNQFELDAQFNPVNVAGVPPDDFSTTGQRWGNPLYNWEIMNDDGFSWWKRRVAQASEMFDAVRIDHFVGIARYWSIPSNSETAEHGRWRRGPGRRLTDAIDSVRGDMDIIAENLGILHPSAIRLLDRTGYHGMNVMEFAFGDSGRPYTFGKRSAVYGATHDNDTLSGWYERLDGEKQQLVADYIGAKSKAQIRDSMIRSMYSLPCDLAMLQMQDVLWLGSSSRMNTPGTALGNWRWRMRDGSFSENVTQKLMGFSKLYGRWE